MTQYNDIEVVHIRIHNKQWEVLLKIKKHWFTNLFWSAQIKESKIRTFVGTGGIDWSEIKNHKYFGVGDLCPILNSVITIELIK